MHVTILGVSGYTGMLLLRLLADHPDVSRITTAARSLAGHTLSSADPGLPQAVLNGGRVDDTVLSLEHALRNPGDVVFSALPHGVSADTCDAILGRVPLIDLSADFRFHDAQRFAAAYGSAPPAPQFQDRAVYGLCEWNRHAIRTADIIGNPGCYPTASLLPLLPLATIGALRGAVVINALSGVSGAGRSEKRNLLFGERTENVNAYNVGTQHRHQAEITEQLVLAGDGAGAAVRPDDVWGPVFFNPHLVPIKQGMAVTTVVRTDDAGAAVEALIRRYDEEPFVELVGESVPETRHVRASNRVRIGWHVEEDHLVLMSVIDNLWKGAASQAVQNMNIRFGCAEDAGLGDASGGYEL